jgi:hypothetical protein
VESVVVPPSPLPPADTSPPRDERLRRLILGRWYDRAENEFHIHDKRDDDSRPVNIRVRQTIKNSDSGYDPPGRVEGEIVRFKCWAPEMANFEGRLVRAPNPSDDTLVGQYIFARGHRDVVLYRSPEPPQPPKLEVPAKIGLPDVTEKSVSDITKWWVGGLPPKR